MVVNYRFVAQKLRKARELLSFTEEEVSQATGIFPERITQVESEQSKPTGDEILILAHFYKHDFRDFLDENRPAPFEQTEILYRRYKNDFQLNDRRAIQEFLYLCEIEYFLESNLTVPRKSFSFQPKGNFYKSHAEEAARELRSFLGYTSHEIARDVFDDFRQIGFHIFRRKLDNKNISGLYIKHPLAGHCLLVNYEEDIYRQRFSISHEAAHAIFDSSDSVMVTYQSGKADLKEVRANRFASCYLMPPESLPRGQNWTSENAISWSQNYRVSPEALSIALEEEKIIDSSTARLIKSVRVARDKKIDPEITPDLTEAQRIRRLKLLERGLSNHYVNLCFEAYQNGIISAGKLSDSLLTDHHDLRGISKSFGRSIKNEF